MGEVPEEYVLIQKAKYLGVAPWELIERSIFWGDKAGKYMTAEVEAQEIRQKNQQNRQ